MTVALEAVPTGLLIGGTWRAAAGGATFEVEDPATGVGIAVVADARPADGAAALDAAAGAQEGWAATPPRERAAILRRAHALVLERAEQLAEVMTLEMGKTIAESRGEVAYGADFLLWFAGEAERIAGRYQTAPDGDSRLLMLRRPVGPALLITPWNFPLAMVTRKVGPAIAAGCTTVLKPAALTPLTALALAGILQEAGLPDGVLNVIPTTSAGDVTGPLLRDPRLRKLSFTGSTPVGQRLLADASQQVLRTSMELGGNAPFLVFDDADLDAAVQGALAAKLRNGGQSCVAANRFLVHESVLEAFSERFEAGMAATRLGPGIETGSGIGALVDRRARDGVHALVEGALAAGARASVGGAVPTGAGSFYPPTVLRDVPRGAEILEQEIFGPVAPIVAFADEDDAVTLANATPYGLTAFAYTRDLDRALRLPERIETGMLGINRGVVSNAAAPFGGVKRSGLGREGGAEGIDEYLETTYVGLSSSWEA